MLKKKVQHIMSEYQEWFEKEILSKKWWNDVTKNRMGTERAFLRDLSAADRGLKDVIEIAPGTFRYSWPAPPMVIEAAKKALDEGHTDYIPGGGFRDFREAVAEKALREDGIEADIDKEIQPTHGVSFSFNIAGRHFLNPGDDVLLIDPDYFLGRVPNFGANVIPVPLTEPTDPNKEWVLNIEELVDRITPNSKMLVMANGNNPTGHLYTKKELEQISEVVQDEDLLVFSDELYSRCVFDGKKHYSIAALPGMKERTITSTSFSKLEAMSGLRIGYVIANSDLIKVYRSISSYETECINTIGQKAGIAALSQEALEWMQKNTLPEVQKRRDYSWEKLNKIEDVTCAKATGTYYLYPNISKYKLGNPRDIIEYFVKEAGVLVRANYGPINTEGHFRISCCAPWERLTNGLERIKEALEKLTRK
ncbi:hypothetical protein CL673_08035 [Candidatus Bathyarchaeota archaeon]|jgi:aspartate/methionine/tyrosine aminotransferase|nr:hypothetical protein [Candidatus Bathyarchaeota archaeon]MDP6048951.1 pyridoxal phosphate-dependent aminotransferase [Candidatus Bathyarchaeota archaeon]|tara:strand:+ start:9008 stop:10273 length:1266 start_codon:yes stop_codon:yes gene_type:complete